MTWEIAVGFFTIASSFIAAMSVVVKVNQTLVMLDEAVRRLTVAMEKQSLKNHGYSKLLADHEMRLVRLEDKEREEDQAK